MVLNTPLQKFDGTAIPKPLRELRRWAPWAAEVVKSFSSYTEISPSGRGLRIFAHGDMDGAQGFDFSGGGVVGVEGFHARIVSHEIRVYFAL